MLERSTSKAGCRKIITAALKHEPLGFNHHEHVQTAPRFFCEDIGSLKQIKPHPLEHFYK